MSLRRRRGLGLGRAPRSRASGRVVAKEGRLEALPTPTIREVVDKAFDGNVIPLRPEDLVLLVDRPRVRREEALDFRQTPPHEADWSGASDDEMMLLDESSPLGTDDIFMPIGLVHSDAIIDRLRNDITIYMLTSLSEFVFFIHQYDSHVEARLPQSVTSACPSRTQSS